MKSRVLIVDGHSMIFQWEDLRALHEQNSLAARERLVQMLTGLQDSSDYHVAVVFDGKGKCSSDASVPDAIQVFYSKAGQTADSIIERLTARYAAEHDLTVATDDLMERTTVGSFGATAISSTQLREEIEQSSQALAERIRKLRR